MNMEAIEVVKPKKTLQQLVLELLQEMESGEGEVTPELDELLDTTHDKVAACCAVIECLESEANGYEERAEGLKSKASSRRKRAQWLRDYMQSCMKIAGLRDVRARLGSASYGARFRNSVAVRVVDPALVPESYTRIVPEQRQVDKRAALPDLKAGREIAGLALETHEYLVLD